MDTILIEVLGKLLREIHEVRMNAEKSWKEKDYKSCNSRDFN